MIYTDNLISALKKRENKIKYSMNYNLNNDIITITNSDYVVPAIVKQFYEYIECLKIYSPREFEMLSFKDFVLFDNKYLWFSTINGTEKICFDISQLNEAKQWNIINYNNKFLITKTIASYLINKIWAWIDKERPIWQEEFYPHG